ncbi:MAG: thymidylate synthase (FAD), partial [Thermoprotei archaeon]
RYVLPQAVTTKIVVTMNARELRHFFGLRTCLKAQWEIRYVAWKMREELLKVHPLLFKWTGPRCINIENVTRKGEPITVEDILSNKAMLTIERCPENIVARNIPRCIKSALSIVSILENRAYNVVD